MPRPCFYLDSTAERDLLLAWHTGQGSLLYAVGSVGALELGSDVYRDNRSDVAWFHDLVLDFHRELHVIVGEGDAEDASLAAGIQDRLMECL